MLPYRRGPTVLKEHWYTGHGQIVAIYVDGGWQKKLRTMVIEEKVPNIVEKFISETSETNCGQRGRNAKIDKVILVNEDHIELANM